MKRLFAALLFLYLFTACLPQSPGPIIGLPGAHPTEPLPENVHLANENTAPMPVPVLYRAESSRGIYEPAEGIYLGAWLGPHTPKRSFTDTAGRRHGVFAYEMHLGESIPTTWILQCIAAQAAPLFIIHPPKEALPHEDAIADLAYKLGTFNLPMFVAFFPGFHGVSQANHGITAQEYTIAFRYARALFLHYAPHIAFVWVAPNAEATAGSPFFPGHDAVDWVGVPLFAKRDDSGFAGDILAKFAPFYQHFQAYHPIMVLPLGVSHFSRVDHAYHIQDAAMEIARVYQGLAAFPRLGLVVYADAFGLSPANPDDFGIFIEVDLLRAYAQAIAGGHFISALEKDAPQQALWRRSAFAGYYWEGRMFIDAETLSAELSMPVPRSTIAIEDRLFVEGAQVAGARISFCETRRAILVKT
ncbi:MAG: hypothetical protein FWG38_01220 [Defluviitaleaceae bacterium]|nr:hypothetical protein [Defluviitaleaceae bacterium]